MADQLTDIRNRIVEVKPMRFGDVKAHPRNPKTHPANQRAAFRGSVAELGFTSVPLAYYSERNGSLTWADGHLRGSEVADYEGSVAILDIDDAEADKLLLYADPIAAMAEYEAAQLDSLMRDVQTSDEALMAMLAGMAAEAGLYPDKTPVQDPGAQIDKADELRQKWGVKPGDLWQLGKHRLICGDCTDKATVERLMQGEKADITFTSPPYNLGENIEISNRPKAMKDKGSVYSGSQDALPAADYLALLRSFTQLCLAVSDYVFVNVQQLAGNKLSIIEYLYEFREHFSDVAIWHKTNQQPAMAQRVMNSCFEYVYILSAEKQPSRAIKTADFRGTFDNVYTSTINVNEYAGSHGAAFPVEFAKHFIEMFCPKVCLEPFAGTGTALIVCESLGKQALCVEISESYTAVCLERWSTATSRQPVRAE